MVAVAHGAETAPTVVEAANRTARAALHDRLLAMPPESFERLVATLLKQVGYANVKVTRRGADGGIDLDADAPVAVGAVPVRVQVKRWKRNVPVEVVRELRGCLSPGERGLIVSTSSFTPAAILASRERDKVPIWLVPGQQMVDMLIEQGLGVRKRRLLLLELEPESSDSRAPTAVSVTGSHDPLVHRPKSARTPSGRLIAIPVGQHFDGDRASLLPIFSALAGAALRESADLDYFAIKRHIVFTVGDGRQRRVIMLVTVQSQRLEVRLRLPSNVRSGDRLSPCMDKAWRNLRYRLHLASPVEVDRELQNWLGSAVREGLAATA